MKAIICKKYGAPEVLELVDLPKPMSKSNEVLVKIVASAVNSGDVRVRALKVDGFLLRLLMRLVLGFTKPRKHVLGTVFSGVIEEVGNKATHYKTGDAVFGITGFTFGTYAEYTTLKEDAIFIHKPTSATHQEAAALPFGGTTALHFLQKTNIVNTPNLEVLIYGATGSVGTAALEIAKYYKAQVTAVCSREGEALARKLGSDEIVIYTESDITTKPKKYDVVFDAVGKTTKKQCKSLLKDKGQYLTVGGLEVAKETHQQLQLLRTLFDTGKLHANIDKVYALSEMIEAHEYVDTGRKKGNVIIDFLKT